MLTCATAATESRSFKRFFAFGTAFADSRIPAPAAACDPAPSVQSVHARQQWSARCVRRLLELRPDADLHSTTAVAAGLWGMVGHFNPEVAAEMEYEVWRCDQ